MCNDLPLHLEIRFLCILKSPFALVHICSMRAATFFRVSLLYMQHHNPRLLSSHRQIVGLGGSPIRAASRGNKCAARFLGKGYCLGPRETKIHDIIAREGLLQYAMLSSTLAQERCCFKGAAIQEYSFPPLRSPRIGSIGR